MTQKEKSLLLQDLCSRLPYGVKVLIEYSKGKYTHIFDLKEIDNDTTSDLRQRVVIWNYGFYSSVISYPLIDCRPYLRPMSSMTEEEKIEYLNTCGNEMDNALSSPRYAGIDYLNAHHFDYRGLIPKDLAIKVTKENNPYKN